MNILILGSGGREHAFAWKLSHETYGEHGIYVTNPNPGIYAEDGVDAYHGHSIIVDINNFHEIKKVIISYNISLVLVGPEIPLINGITDFILNDKDLSGFKHRRQDDDNYRNQILTDGVKVIGPSKLGSMLEGSKEFAKNFMKKYKIPTASYKSFNKLTINDGIDFIKNNYPPYVLKADGPAAGKGVIIVDNAQDAIKNLEEMLIHSKFGKSSETVVIEEFLSGIEMSCFVIFDGINYKILPYAKDYKRIGEGDTGLNTGGMGAISPVNFLDNSLKDKIKTEIIEPTINGLISEKINYVGFIFIGLINVNGQPKVIEYNVRMGDPETQVILPRITNDFSQILICCANQTLDKIDLKFKQYYYTNVVLASRGYPEDYKKGLEITGLNDIKNSIVFHAGTAGSNVQIGERYFNGLNCKQGYYTSLDSVYGHENHPSNLGKKYMSGSEIIDTPGGGAKYIPGADNDKIITNGGRVLSVVSGGNTMSEALKKSYSNIEKINFDGKVFRKDIGFDL